MYTRWIIIALLLMGAAAFLYVYHYRPRKFDLSQRKRVLTWPLYRIVDWYLKIASVAVTVLALRFDSPWLLEFHRSPYLLIVGLVLTAAGLALFAVTMRHLDSQYTPCYAAHLPTRIVMTGPYRFIRHPLYTSNIVLMLGLLFVSGSLWMLVNLAILLLYYLPIILREEGAIASEFPEYRDYAARTGRFFPKLLKGRVTA